MWYCASGKIPSFSSSEACGVRSSGKTSGNGKVTGFVPSDDLLTLRFIRRAFGENDSFGTESHGRGGKNGSSGTMNSIRGISVAID